MLSFACDHCGHLVFFENTRCLNCSTPQGFVPERMDLVALEGEASALHRCANQTLAACNWMVGRVDELCRSCALTRTRPNDARREQRRSELDEPYRTMLGHLRHELGHYFQPLFVCGEEQWAACRELFGDERQDYGAALERHYEQGTPDDWPDRSLKASPQPEAGERSFDEVLDNWLPLTYALNAVNRSMGSDDLYPFTLAEPVIEKLRFVHQHVQKCARPPVG